MPGLEALSHAPNALGWAAGVGIFLASFLGSIAVAAIVAVRLPPNSFVAEQRPLPLAGRPLARRVAASVLRNLLGMVLIALGVVMSLPGVPGQGLLTILFGIMLTDLPGKRRLERAIIGRRLVRDAITKLRAKYDKPPLVYPD